MISILFIHPTTMNRIDIPDNRRITAPDSYEKGRLFEDYLIKLFNEDHFALVKWRKSQKINDKLTLLTHS